MIARKYGQNILHMQDVGSPPLGPKGPYLEAISQKKGAPMGRNEAPVAPLGPPGPGWQTSCGCRMLGLLQDDIILPEANILP